MDCASHGGTDTSTDPDLDKNQAFERGHAAAGLTPPDSSHKSNGELGPKTLRRLAQNREAARRSRLRKKAYVQQLESSGLRLARLEQELQRARQQGFLISTLGDQPDSENGDAASSFYVEHARWLEEHHKQVDELRAAVGAHAGDGDLQAIVDTVMARCDEIFRLKGAAAKADAFRVLSGTWGTPVERCFLWLGGFRPSELLMVPTIILLASRLEPLTEKQLDSIDVLRRSSLQAEEALSREMEALRQSVTETVAAAGSSSLSCSDDDCTGQMAVAVGKLGAMEGLLRQADDLRLRILEETRRVLTTRQCARAVLVVTDYFSRMRALSSLWIARPTTGVN
ncbi:transcription factor HBP-1b(c1)-like isoform X2 [Triticum dicoccoides]|uniref:transcription factor HBP-1b(c1)-like isoform X2 n=1 Tax=Triticum dicoccoides TaxID=85692 RepID=UPI00188FC16A|nr:transcription factor HBP-1b(c1)-like isoform X2 [Triticum dicoccoides]